MHPHETARAFILTATLLLFGCTYWPQLDVDLDNPPGVAKVPKTVGVYYSPRFRAYMHTDTHMHRWVLPVGSASVDLFDQAFPLMFKSVVSVSTLPPPGTGT